MTPLTLHTSVCADLWGSGLSCDAHKVHSCSHGWLPVLSVIGYGDSQSPNKRESESQPCLVQFFGFVTVGWGTCVEHSEWFPYLCLQPPSLSATLILAQIGSSSLPANSAMLQSTQGVLWRGKEQVSWADWSPLKWGQSCYLTPQLPPQIL